MNKRFFTVQEANALIPFLTERVRELRSLYDELRNTYKNRTFPPQEVLSNGGMPVDGHYFHLICNLQTVATEIDSKGCQIKDLESGLIDFPTIWEGREVYLCWKLGESEVSFWHEVDAGFAGRQPLKRE
jgi:hypothetical protein